MSYNIDDNIVYILTIADSNIPMMCGILNILYINDTWYFLGTYYNLLCIKKLCIHLYNTYLHNLIINILY